MAVNNHKFRMILTKDYTPPKGFQQVDATNFWRDWIKNNDYHGYYHKMQRMPTILLSENRRWWPHFTVG